MNWKIFFSTVVTIFLAELGDKTQLASLSLAAESGPWPVFLGAVTAFALVTFLTVMLGGVIGKILRPEWIRYAAGVLFLMIGFLLLLGKI